MSFSRKSPRLSQHDVVQAAIYCLEKEGEKSLGVNRIARELGIKPPSVYNHVKGNTELYRLVAIEGNRLLGQHFQKHLPQGKNVQEQLFEMAIAFRGFIHQHPHLYLVMTNTVLEQDDPDFVTVQKETIGVFLKVLSPLKLDETEQIHFVRALRAAVHGFSILEVKKQFGMPFEIEESFKYLVDSIIVTLVKKHQHQSIHF